MPNPAKPTALKVAQGNPGKRRLNRKEPKPAGRLGTPPAALSQAAKQVWRYYAPILEKLSVATAADRAAFEAFCRSYALWRQLRKDGEGQPLVKVNGQVVPNPMLSLAAKEFKEWAAIAREFGLTPSARARLTIDDGSQADELEEFLAGSTPTPMRLAEG